LDSPLWVVSPLKVNPLQAFIGSYGTRLSPQHYWVKRYRPV